MISMTPRKEISLPDSHNSSHRYFLTLCKAAIWSSCFSPLGSLYEFFVAPIAHRPNSDLLLKLVH